MSKSERLKIRLSDKYQITADQHNYILQQVRISEKGNEYESNIAYYGSLGRLVNGLLENEIKTSQTNDLKALCRKLIEVEREITTKLEKVVFQYEQVR